MNTEKDALKLIKRSIEGRECSDTLSFSFQKKFVAEIWTFCIMYDL